MTRTIQEFPLSLVERQIIEMPIGAHFLSLQSQGGALTLWALVAIQLPLRSVEVTIIGTGYPAPEGVGVTSYVGTTQQGAMVWHVFAKFLVP